MKGKPQILKSVFSSLLALIVFSLVYFLVFLVLGGIILVLSNIPVIGSLVKLLFYFRGDSPDMMLSLMSPIVAYFVATALLEKINKLRANSGLACILLGVFILLIHVPSLVINLLAGDAFLANITQGIAGVVFIISGHGILKECSDQ